MYFSQLYPPADGHLMTEINRGNDYVYRNEAYVVVYSDSLQVPINKMQRYEIISTFVAETSCAVVE
jgi:hypothetical protein